MNIFFRLGNWWENRRKVSIKEFQAFKESQRNPSIEAKELVLFKARMDRLELFVGLKREQGPVKVENAPRIV